MSLDIVMVIVLLAIAGMFGMYIFYNIFQITKELSKSLLIALVASLVSGGIMVWLYFTNPYGFFDKLPKNSDIVNNQTKQLNDLNKN